MSFAHHLEIRKKNLEEFLALLKEEQTLYSAVALPGQAMQELAERKVALAAKAEQLHKMTNDGLAKLQMPQGLEGAKQLAAQSNCLDTMMAIVDLAEKARAQNEVNGTLLQMRWKPTKEMVAWLQKLSGETLYGPDGKSARNSLGGVNARA